MIGRYFSMGFALALAALSSPRSAAQDCDSTEYWACDSDWEFRGPEGNDHMGFAVSAVGDWNGDGVPDILVGGTYPWDVAGKDHEGMAAIFFGPPSVACDSAPDLIIRGGWQDGQGECFGYDVAFIGDVDGDGKDDFAVGSPRAPYGTPAAGGDDRWLENGQLYVYLSSLYPSTGSFTANSANLIIRGAAEGDRLGTSIAEVGDFDSDGVDDFQWDGDGIPESCRRRAGRRVEH